MNVLVTGGCGYIGGHVVVALLEAGHEISVIDDLSNSDRSVLDSISVLTDREIAFVEGDVRDLDAVERALRLHRHDAVVHLAGLKHVADSAERAVDYHSVNVGGLVSLLRGMQSSSTRTIVFSSSGSVYGRATHHRLTETTPHRPTNPYSRTKSICEQILADVCRHDGAWRALSLRYFNPAGAHPSGLIGEAPSATDGNVMPALLDAALGVTPGLVVNGHDFDTPDGTAIRDYVHVQDVAEAHVLGLAHVVDTPGHMALNVGRGTGTSVLELLSMVEAVSGRTIPFELGPRRRGDVAQLVADTAQAAKTLGPRSYRRLDQICEDAWRWHRLNAPTRRDNARTPASSEP